jgi:cysteine desulfurase/selenocysteine lyase
LALGAAINYMKANVNFNDLVKYEANLCALLLDGLLKITGIKIAGNIEQIKETGHLVSFAIEGIHPHDLASYLGTKNIAVRAGHHCAQPLIKLLGFNSLLRVSFAAYNAPEEIDVFLKYLNEAIKFFRSL